MRVRKVQQAPAHTFLHKSSLGLAAASWVILPPFVINNFIKGQTLLGIGTLAILMILAFHAWTILRHNRYYPLLILLSLIPAILCLLGLSLRNQGLIGILWCYPAVISLYFTLPETKAWIANAVLLVFTLPSAWQSFERPLATRMTVTLLLVSCLSAIFIRVITEQQQKLQAQAVTDPLTGVFNRMLLQESLDQAIHQNNRARLPMSLIAFDLDHFKKINDTLGHDAGDAILQGVGDLLKQRCRSVDKVFRLGGEEFLVLLYNTDTENSRTLAEELRESIASLASFPGCPITVSVGVATLHNGETRREWMKRSDEKLYQAKLGGRNRVVA